MNFRPNQVVKPIWTTAEDRYNTPVKLLRFEGSDHRGEKWLVIHIRTNNEYLAWINPGSTVLQEAKPTGHVGRSCQPTGEAKCSRCKPGKPCLSHSFLPFGSCWLELDNELLKKYPERRIKDASGRLKQDDSGRYFFNLKGLSFDETPLGYLDWLAGQEWLRPGIFRNRLFAYLKHPCIQKELEDLFPDPDDASRKPLMIHDQGLCKCKTDDSYRHKWHGQCMPRGDTEELSENLFYSIPEDPFEEMPRDHPPRDANGYAIPLPVFKAWRIVLDFIMQMENETFVNPNIEVAVTRTRHNGHERIKRNIYYQGEVYGRPITADVLTAAVVQPPKVDWMLLRQALK